MLISRGYFLLSLVIFLLFSASAWADDELEIATDEAGARTILEKMDENNIGYDDLEMSITMTIIDSDGSQKSYDFWVMQHGRDKRLVKFTSGELKGMSVLTSGPNLSHVYLPGYKRVRRVAPHNMDQTLAGSDFTNNDMGSSAWADVCNSSMENEDEEAWYVRCVPVNNAPYSYLVFKVAKDGYHQKQIAYYNKAGEMYKVMNNTNLVKWPGGDLAHSKVTMTTVDTKHKTVLTIHAFKANQGLRESIFTVRNLRWQR